MHRKLLNDQRQINSRKEKKKSLFWISGPLEMCDVKMLSQVKTGWKPLIYVVLMFQKWCSNVLNVMSLVCYMCFSCIYFFIYNNKPFWYFIIKVIKSRYVLR